MRLMPSIFIFWVISTALVLQGVIISLRGPTKMPSRLSLCEILPQKSHSNALILLLLSSDLCSTAITVSEFELKKEIISLQLSIFLKPQRYYLYLILRERLLLFY